MFIYSNYIVYKRGKKKHLPTIKSYPHINDDNSFCRNGCDSIALLYT